VQQKGGKDMNIDIKNDNGAAIARLSGEIDHHNARELRAELDRFIVTAQPRELAIDFGGITFMDSSGIGLIMGRSKLMKECGGRLEVRNPQPYIRRVLKLAGLERIVRIR
jgi:stage II sporulation protein AA (anti-sigma F factor antagonist)